MAAYALIWTDTATADLNEICEHVARHDPAAAERLGRGILDHVQILESFPMIGPTYPRHSRGPLREVVYETYRILYEVNAKTRRVDILRIWHAARLEPPYSS